MKNVEDNCAGCTGLGLSCMGSGCPNHYPEVYYTCDVCGKKEDTIYDVDGLDMCEDCIKNGQKAEFMKFLEDEYFEELWDAYKDGYLEDFEVQGDDE